VPDFSVIAQTPQTRSIVQERHLERAMHDALYPALLFRGEASPKMWGANVGDSTFFTAPGLMDVNLAPVPPGADADVATYGFEQWLATMQQFARSTDIHAPTAALAIVDLFDRHIHQIGLNAGQVINRLVRDRLFNAAFSGNTVTDVGGAAAATTLHVVRLNGFTTARRPDLSTGSPVRFDTVSAGNPQPILINVGGVLTANTVIGFTPDFPGDQVGPGVLTLGAAIGGAGAAARAAVLAVDRSVIIRPGGGTRIDDVLSTSLFRLDTIRAMVARVRLMNVPPHEADKRYHMHIDPTTEAQIFSDPENQRLNTSLPDYYPYKDFAAGELFGVLFYRNTEEPLATIGNVRGTTSAVTAYDPLEPFGGEMFGGSAAGTTSGVVVHRPILTGMGVINEYYQDLGALITEAGILGKAGEFQLTNDGIDIYVDRVMLLVRSAANRLADQISATWKFLGDWPVRTDVLTGDVARYKRLVIAEHGE
jgi:hypothetical protein